MDGFIPAARYGGDQLLDTKTNFETALVAPWRDFWVISRLFKENSPMTQFVNLFNLARRSYFAHANARQILAQVSINRTNKSLRF